MKWPLRSLWIALLLTGVMLLADDGAGYDSMRELRNRQLVWLAFWLAGLGALFWAQARDPGATRWREAGLRAAVPLGISFALWLQVLAPAARGIEIVLVAMLAAIGVFALWGLSPSGTVLSRRAIGFSVLAITTLLLLGMGELFSRLPGVVAQTGGTNEAKRRYWETQLDADAVAAGNAWRRRSRHLEPGVADAGFPIATLGDSFTAGDWVPSTDDIWPYVLERALLEDRSDVRVLNFAGGGTTQVHQLDALEQMVWWTHPDLLVLQMGINDSLPPDRGSTSVFRTTPLIPLLHRGLLEKSYLYALVSAKVRALQFAARYPDGYGPLFADDAEGWIRTREAIVEIAEQCRARGVALLVVLFPTFEPSLEADEYRYIDEHRLIGEFIENQGLPFLDLRPVFAATDPIGRNWWILPWDSHPNEAAHELAGRAIAGHLRDLDYLHPSDSPDEIPGRSFEVK